jgi:hypothetical protein
MPLACRCLTSFAIVRRRSTATTPIRPPRSFRTRSASRPIDVAKYCFPITWPADREQRAAIIGEWLQTEARYLARCRRRTGCPNFVAFSGGLGCMGIFSVPPQRSRNSRRPMGHNSKLNFVRSNSRSMGPHKLAQARRESGLSRLGRNSPRCSRPMPARSCRPLSQQPGPGGSCVGRTCYSLVHLPSREQTPRLP